MNIYFRELGNESPLLVKLIMQSIYKNNDRKVRHLGSKRFGIQFLIKGIYTYNGDALCTHADEEQFQRAFRYRFHQV